MKTILVTLVLFFPIIMLNAQNSDYSAQWKKVEAFEKKGLTQSALKEVESIFTLAIRDKNDVQQVKAAMYQMKYKNLVEEDSRVNNVFYIDTLISKAKAPVKNILYSMQAELLMAYKNQNRWKLYNRTELANEDSTDLQTWSIQKLNTEIEKKYKLSLQQAQLLQNTKLDAFEAIIDKGQNSRHLRPTLYDLLAHRAIDYFMNDENDLADASYKFIINDERYFSQAKDFINLSIQTRDTASRFYHALKLFQQLIRFHLGSNSKEALLDADLKRLEFVKDRGVFTDKNKRYEQALLQLDSQFSGLTELPVRIRLAEFYYELATSFENDPEKKDSKTKNPYFVKAEEIAEDIIRVGEGSNEAAIAGNLLTQIRRPFFTIETEKVLLPEMAFKSFISYKNISKIYLRIIRVDENQLRRIENFRQDGQDALFNYLSGLPAFRQWSQQLPESAQRATLTAEFKTDALPAGHYLFAASMNENFQTLHNVLSYAQIAVSTISYIYNNKQNLYVLNRESGEPIPGARVQVWRKHYDYKTRAYNYARLTEYTADRNGMVSQSLNDQENRYQRFLKIFHGQEELISDDQYFVYRYNYNPPQKPRTQVFLFTDRSIYRPGQTVFFKGIAVRTAERGRKNDVVAGYKASVQLFDANGEKVSSIPLVTNKYGSYNSSFTLPSGILSGSFRIVDSASNSGKSIQVEEYKRPKFAVEVQKPIGTYRLNDTIRVTGNAKAYAGNNIDGALVKYRVVRKVIFPPWYRSYFRPWPPFGGNRMEITNGETVTNAAGDFSFSFKAIPDETVDKKNQPTFYYEVIADVTDLNGETRSATQSIAIAYQALQISIEATSPMPPDSVKNIRIFTRNMNNLHERSSVEVEVYSLREPGRVFRKRYWQVPDTVLLSKPEFEKHFPYDAYGHEDKMENWPLESKVAEGQGFSDSSGNFTLSKKSLPAGWYKILVNTKDRFGEDVKAEQFFRVQSALQEKTTEPFVISIEKDAVQPGEKIKYAISTAFDKIWLVHTVSKTGDKQETFYPNISSSANHVNDIKINESDRGGISLNIAFVKHNRVYSGSDLIKVPWSNKDLRINYETFRDKLLPGATEKWTITISGPQADRVAAETLVGMYDASLDQFMPHSWQSLQSLWPVMGNNLHWTTATFASHQMNPFENIQIKYKEVKPFSYDQLKNEGWGYFNSYFARAGQLNEVIRVSGREKRVELSVAADAVAPQMEMKASATGSKAEEGADTTQTVGIEQPGADAPNTTVRKNFNETAFFFPDLVTNEKGEVSFSFTMPEALTIWKMLTIAHNTNLASVYSEKTIITQKPLMVQPNAPRFMREGDEMEFTAKIVNLSPTELSGISELELIDAATNQPVDGWFKNQFSKQYFTVAAGQSALVKFPMSVPYEFQSTLLYRIKAHSNTVSTTKGEENFSDGEEMALPVLTNRTLVTEALPLNMKGTGTQTFKFDKLLQSGNSNTLTHKAVTVEYSSNPIWYAVQALPYLMEYPYDCAEQVFNRFYANALASHITAKMPKIKAVLDLWAKDSSATSALISNLQKNQELKNALLEETPWVMDAKNETEQKKNIALLFDLVRIAREKSAAIQKLREMQLPDGSFPWFRGGYHDRYITQYIVAGIGHLRKLNAISAADWAQVQPILQKAMPYLDAMVSKDYELLKRSKIKLTENHLSYIGVHYLYARSFFDIKMNDRYKPAFEYYKSQAEKYWLNNSRYIQAMIALALHRMDNNKISKDIVASLKQNAIQHPELGMYWKELTGGYYWYQAPVEIQSVLIEAFNDVTNDRASVDGMKTWLLKQKQVQKWESTKATADAVYALLLSGTDWTAINRTVSIKAGEHSVNTSEAQASTGYIKKTITGRDVKPSTGNISVTVSGDEQKSATTGISWGAVYWQYFEQLDKITRAETPLSLKKQLFIEKNGDRGPVLKTVEDGATLKIGDKVKVRIELRVDREMEYIHMKDMRAAAFEPTNVISSFKWQGGLGYYESTKDASTNFFFNRLPRGTYIFEYPLFVTHAGNFSNGITTIQCMYAPEFTSHSEGVRIRVEEN